VQEWNGSVAEAVEIQRRLRDRVIPKPPARFKPRLIAGADVSMERFGDRAWAGIVVLDARTLETVETASAEAELRFPYIPGLLSFRELPPLAEAWARLRHKPDVLIFDGVGYAHPRRFGIASHGGVLFDVPSIGCAKSILVGTPGPLAPERGSTAELIAKGEVVGMAVRLRDRVAPVYVSRGHRMDLRTAVRIVESVSRGYRLPETTRRAHALVNELRRRAH
jgi:deoxyribonuclease V